MPRRIVFWRQWLGVRRLGRGWGPGDGRALGRAEARLRDDLGILRPREVLLPQPVSLFPSSVPAASELNGLGAVETRLDDWLFETNHATRLLEEHFRVGGVWGFGFWG